MGRYDRNILINKIGTTGQEKLFEASVLVCGAGGLGSGVISNIASLGVRRMGIVDNDKVEITNLNRQYIHKESSIGSFKVDSAQKWINEYNPDIVVQTYKTCLDKTNACELIAEYDIIADCFDNMYSKFILSNSVVKSDKTLVHGGVEEFFGQVTVISKDTACLSCFMPQSYNPEEINLKRGIISPVVSTIAAIQSMEIFKIITGVGTPLKNTILVYNGLEETYKKINVQKNKNCSCCAK